MTSVDPIITKKEDINLKAVFFCRHIWKKILPSCPTLFYTDLEYIDWLENIWNNAKLYNKNLPHGN